MPSQRPYFLSSFIAAFRQQPPAIQSSAPQQPAKHHSPQTPSSSPSSHTYSTSTAAAAAAAAASASAASSTSRAATAASHHQPPAAASVAIHSPRSGSIPIPNPGARRRGSDSSTEGFRDVIGADKWYIGGRTAGGEEKFFKLGVVRRVRSNDGLSLDRLSL